MTSRKIPPTRYYSEKLSALNLRRCYEIAPERVQQYLNAEIEHVLSKIKAGGVILDLGCGYARVLARLADKARLAVGIDTSLTSLQMGAQLFGSLSNAIFIQMDAVHLAFQDSAFDATICIQNGLSAFKVDQLELIRESIRVTRAGGIALFSSYAEKFWPHRLQWFQMQAREGLLGEIDPEKTRDGIIVCKDGFRATTIRPNDFISLTSRLGLVANIEEVDESSVFCEIVVVK